MLEIDSTGSGNFGVPENQQIVLQNIDLLGLGGTQEEIIDSMLATGNLDTI